MPPPSAQAAIEGFWAALQNVAKEVLTEGARYGYGFSLVEIKFQGGLPSVAINSHTESHLYKSQTDALSDIWKVIAETRAKGSQTLTIVREKDGEIKRVLLDEYSMTILKDG